MTWEALTLIIGAIGGLEGVRYFVNWRENRRIERAKATGSELQTIKDTNQFLQQQLLEKEQRFAEQTKRLRETQDLFFKEKERRHKAELELSVKRCNDIHCPFREPPTAHTPPKPGMTKEKYHEQKTKTNDDNQKREQGRGSQNLAENPRPNG